MSAWNLDSTYVEAQMMNSFYVHREKIACCGVTSVADKCAAFCGSLSIVGLHQALKGLDLVVSIGEKMSAVENSRRRIKPRLWEGMAASPRCTDRLSLWECHQFYFISTFI